MSLWRRFLRAMGFGSSFKDSTIIIRGEDGVTVIDGVTIIDDETVIANGKQVKIDLGPEMERTFEALGPISDAVSLSKETPDIGLRLRKFNADISVVATDEVTAPVITVTGPQKIVESITSGLNDGFFELTVQERELVTGSQISIQVFTAILSLGKRPRVQVQAKVPLHAPLSFKDTSGVVRATGTFGALDGTFEYDTEATFSVVTDATVSTDSSCNLTVSKMTGNLDADLDYNSTLEIEAGSAGDCVIKADSSCAVRLNAIVNSLRAKLEYNSTLITQSEHLTSADIKADSSCEAQLNAVHVDVLNADLEYNSSLRVNAQIKKATVRADSSCTVELTSSLERLKADLEYNSTLKIGGSVNKLMLDADSSCEITVNGAINTGSLKADFNTTVTAWRVESAVDRSGMSEDSRLIVTG